VRKADREIDRLKERQMRVSPCRETVCVFPAGLCIGHQCTVKNIDQAVIDERVYYRKCDQCSDPTHPSLSLSLPVNVDLTSLVTISHTTAKDVWSWMSNSTRRKRIINTIIISQFMTLQLSR